MSQSKHTGPSREARSQCLETTPFSVAESSPWRVVTCECEVRATDPNDPSTCASPPACLKESDLGWCQRRESTCSYSFSYHEKFLCYFKDNGCAVEYKCLGSACVPAGRYVIYGGSGSRDGTYGHPTQITGYWVDMSLYDSNIKCCGHIDGGSSSASAPVIKESSPDVLWNVAKNTWGLFGLTWSFLAIALALSVYQYCTGSRTRVARMRRAQSRVVFMPAVGRSGPVVQPNVVIAPNTQPGASV